MTSKSVRDLNNWIAETWPHGSMSRTELTELSLAIEQEQDEMVSFCGRLEEAALNEEEITIFGVDYMPLPRDPDKVSIHVDDKVYVKNDFEHQHVVKAISPDGVWFGGDEPVDPSLVRHHGKPTVRDILFEFGCLYGATGSQPNTDELRDKLLTQYSAKLRMAYK